MADFEQLDQALEAILGSAEVADLMCVASALRDLPDETYRRNLLEELMTATQPVYAPKGFSSITPYLVVPDADRFIAFVKAAFGAEEVMRVKRPDGSIMHAQVNLAESPLEVSEGNAQHRPEAGALHLYVPDVDAIYEQAVAAGATVLHPLTDQPYGDREVSLRDPAGNNWYVATNKERPEQHIRAGLRTLTPYFHIKDTPAFFSFLERAFGAKVEAKHESSPGNIVYSIVRIGDAAIEASEAHGQWQSMPIPIHLYVPDPDATYAKAIAAGATSIYPPADQPYGERNSGVMDAWGNRWWIAAVTGERP